MSDVMLGGDVTQIREGATAYRALGDDLSASGGQVVSTTSGLVGGLQEQLTTAQSTLVSTLQAVSDESRSVLGRFGGMTWTGTNRAQVEEVGAELDARIADTSTQIQALFDTVRADVDRLGGELTEVATQYNLVAASAAESATSLATAMDTQALQLEEVMNTGITRAA